MGVRGLLDVVGWVLPPQRAGSSTPGTVRSGTMPPVVRRPAVFLTLIATAGLLAACGSSSHSTAATVGHTTAGARTPPATGTTTGVVRPPTKAQAIAFARAVNLTAADVPGFRATSTHEHEHEHETAAEKRLEHELLRCTGGVLNSRNGLAEVSSKDFKLEHDGLGFSVSSQVAVAQTSALAAKELAAIHGVHVRGCLPHYLNLLLKDQLLKEFKEQKLPQTAVGPTSISILQGTPPAPGAAGSFGWRITATITVRNIRLPIYIYILGFVYGPAEVSLVSYGTLKPFPAAGQEHLYWLLLKRAKAHSV